RPEIPREILELCAAGAAVLLVSTDVDELAELADRCVVFDRGAVVAGLAQEDRPPGRLVAAITRTAPDPERSVDERAGPGPSRTTDPRGRAAASRRTCLGVFRP